jgi:hypothetical protein
LSVVAAFFRSKEPEIFAQCVQQRNSRLDLQVPYRSVGFQRNCYRALSALSVVCADRFGSWRGSVE